MPLRHGDLLALLAGLLTAGLLATLAWAGGGGLIRDAPTIGFGDQIFGSTAAMKFNGNCCYQEWWKVPLLAGDKLTINIENASPENGSCAASGLNAGISSAAARRRRER